jgi:predicted nucleic acid-binding protein
MIVIVDSTMLTCLVLGDRRAAVASHQLSRWFKDDNITVYAPSLLPFEVAGFLTRSIAAGLLVREELSETWRFLWGMPIKYRQLANFQRVIEVAGLVGDRGGFDSAYLVLGEELDAPLWTLNDGLFRRASKAGFRVKQPAQGPAEA